MSRRVPQTIGALGEFRCLDAVALSAAVAAGDVEVAAVIDASLGELTRIEDSVNPCTVVLAEEARRVAAAIDGVPRPERTAAPLLGVPVAIKDPIWVEGAAATMGSRAFADFVAPADAASVRRLRQAGAVVVAKTISPEFGWPPYCGSTLHGLARNPWNLERTPGASSGGSAAAVAAGAVPIALGADALGSIRIPAAYCGVVGVKPTTGLVPTTPGFANYRTTDAVGPLTRSVADAAAALRAIAGYDHGRPFGPPPSFELGPLDDATSLAGLRVAWSEDLGFATVSEPARECLRETVELVRDLGAEVERAHPDRLDHDPIVDVVYLAELGPPPPSLDAVEHPTVRAMLEARAGLSAARLVDAELARDRYAAAWQAFFDDFDILLTPTLGTAAFDADPRGEVTVDGLTFHADESPWYELAIPASLAGQPAISVPMGSDAEGLPLGLQIQGPRYADMRCLRVAAAIERVRPWPILAPIPS
ncbi:MAG: amidase [Actinobacteria bacterium]|nr:amidase [Actinomycetota bacterium]